MIKKGILLLVIFLSSLQLGNTQNKKALKEIKRVISSSELVFIAGGEFTSGKCSVVNDNSRKQLHEDEAIHLRRIPARKRCASFLISNHEVTVREYLAFVFSVTKKSRLEAISDRFKYTFSLSGKQVSTGVVPQLAYMGGAEKLYLTDKKYLDYPIMGVSWIQANAYIHWLNTNLNKTLQKHSISSKSMQFILPDYLQWEYASFMSPPHKQERLKEMKYYPWQGQKLTTKKGKYKANFGPIKTQYGVTLKKYHDDEHTYTAPVKSFPPNNKLYDMAGNVSEWTAPLSPESDKKYEEPINGQFVKGGSFMSLPIFMQVGISQVHPEEHYSNEIGFRIGMKMEEQLIEKLKLNKE